MSETTELRNYGQYAGVNYGGMHTHRHETRLLSRLIVAQRLDRGRIEEVLKRFAPRTYRISTGPELDRAGAAALLATSPFVVVVGEYGSGLGTAAEALLKEFSEQGRRLERIRIDDEQSGQFAGTDLPAEQGVVYLLRLPRQPGLVGPHVAEEIRGHAALLSDLDAHLLVTASPDVWRAAGGFGGPHVLEAIPPSGVEVLRHHSFAKAVDVDAVLAHTPVADLLDRASVADAAHFARILEDAAGTDEDISLDQLVTDTLGAYRGWREVLSRWFDDKQHGLRERLFLTAAAMLEGRPAHQILDVLDELGNNVSGLPSYRAEGFAAAGLHALKEAIDADIQDGLLRFRKPGYAEATLSFLYGDRETRFRAGLWKWAVGLPLGRGRQEAQDLGNQIAEMMVKIVLRHFDVAPLYELKRWADEENLHDVVLRALTAAAVSEEVGQQVRAQLYDWASTDSTDVKLQRVIARVCAGDMAESYPRISFTRLGHLAGRRDSAVREEVITAVVMLWKRPQLRHRIIRAVTTWMGESSRLGTAWGIASKLAASEVHPLAVAAEHDGTLRDLVRAFGEALTDPSMVVPADEFGSSTLTNALGSPADRELAVRFFVDVVRYSSGGSRRIVRLQRMLFTWQPGAEDVAHPDRRDLRDHIAEALAHVDPVGQG
ncbi:hypothetical protein FHR83_001735 [Actinoplanes campanulatus]|uniref:Uncharacterized protein n=1 Tax=Actinoplanes campanulatus TaxID=113559 RepID=A0A7W5ADC9_9ACTN|nr:hypothetical protein [Actinoplanes campanulatus]MBB3094086.1 hypothetical protein [Actinoplanes campanulatus]GGN32917.1 hypothetical protein GCM10010109_54410 [Actinoplanes campanulatus]GID38216.1 hypothetical protein Aca09nite_47220 [Actinoplanes campanulatus]